MNFLVLSLYVTNHLKYCNFPGNSLSYKQYVKFILAKLCNLDNQITHSLQIDLQVLSLRKVAAAVLKKCSAGPKVYCTVYYPHRHKNVNFSKKNCCITHTDR